ncbi:hypothetical protein Pcinc_019204 [Petrolisthes cinctipes]|uniref:Uncharacterized protein n=1 Tax=Petrolisthes cinctipes TaxID=88211 RepID=A0AAE1FLV7_PETCI|nr:hypothetical protein Pcinc_019204 [Petrolisthes cinctipes]
MWIVVVLLVGVADALPTKPTKTSPKKYDPSVHGPKDTYTTYKLTPDEDLEVPAPSPYIDALLPPSTYDNTYFGYGPRLSILPPEGSSYIGLTGNEGSHENMSPPPADTYSSPEGVAVGVMVPPPVDAPVPDPSSYLSHTGEGQEAMLVVPELSSYAHMGQHASGGHEVLASLAAMARALPHLSSYTHYGTQEQEEEDVQEVPITHLMPPNAQSQQATPQHTSYSETLTTGPEVTDAQISAAQEANVKVPSRFLEPPAP